MGLLARLFGLHSGGADARAEAERWGVRVGEVERAVPQMTRSGRLIRLEPYICVRYSIGRIGPAFGPTWAFLQRGDGTDDRFPNGWTFEGPPSVLRTPVGEALERIASDWTEELLELEADSNGELHAFWEEWGGAEQAARVIGYLEAIRAADASATQR